MVLQIFDTFKFQVGIEESGHRETKLTLKFGLHRAVKSSPSSLPTQVVNQSGLALSFFQSARFHVRLNWALHRAPTSDFLFWVLSCYFIHNSPAETQKWHQYFSRPSDSWVMAQNGILHVLMNNSRTVWPVEIIIPLLSFSKKLFQGAYYFPKRVLITLR